MSDIAAVRALGWLAFAALSLARCAPVDPIQQKCLYQAEAAVLPDMNADNPEMLSQITDLRAACQQLNGE